MWYLIYNNNDSDIYGYSESKVVPAAYLRWINSTVHDDKSYGILALGDSDDILSRDGERLGDLLPETAFDFDTTLGDLEERYPMLADEDVEPLTSDQMQMVKASSY